MFFGVRRPNQTSQEELKSLYLQVLCIARLKHSLLSLPVTNLFFFRVPAV